MPKSGASTFLNHRVEMSEDGYVSSHLATVHARPNVCDGRFLLYYLSTVRAQDLIQDHKYPSLTLGTIGDIRVPLPPLGEQKRIVAVLDQAFVALDRARANAETSRDDAARIFGSYLNERCGELLKDNSKRKLIDLCGNRGVTYGVIKLGEHLPDGVPCLRTSNVRRLEIDTDGMKRIEPTLSTEYDRTVLRGGEVLVNVRGTLGGVAVVPAHMAGWNISREVAMVDIEDIDPNFVALCIASDDAQLWLTGVVKGAAYKGINLFDLRQLEIPVPERKVQTDFVRAVSGVANRMQELGQNYDEQIRDIERMRQSLLQAAFSGQLT